MNADPLALDGAPDLSSCAQEPIHIPGLIQPHGMLLALGAEGRVSHASANFSVDGCPDAAGALGRTLAELLGSEIAGAAIRASDMAAMHLPETAFVGTLSGNTRLAPVQVSAHRFDGRMILDIEPISPDEHDGMLSLSWLYQLQDDMRLARDNQEIGHSLAHTLREVTGYDRMMVYEFDQDWHGHVIGEAQAPGLEPLYLDLHFPASDIPAQARLLYQKHRLRIVVDSRAAGVPLLTTEPLKPLDMSFATLRSVSPVHLHYLRNMGVRATIVASILVGDALWGLVVGHHSRAPRMPSRLARKAMQFAAMLAGGVLSTLTLATTLRLTQAVAETIDTIAARPRGTGWALAVAQQYPALAAELGLDGLSLRVAGELAEAGDPMPPPPVWENSDPVLLTERFPRAVMPRSEPGGIVGGALFRIDDTPSDVVLLGRREYVRDVHWGGDPTRPAQASAEHPQQLTPRKSFALWVEQVQGRCRPFNRPEIAAISLFHQRLSLLVQAEKEQHRRERANQTERLSAIGLVAGGVAHDLNNLLGVISLNLDIALEQGTWQGGQPYVRAAMKAVESGAQVTSALLSFARKQQLQPVDIDPRQLLPEFASMAKVLLGKGISIETNCTPTVGWCQADLGQLQTALLNLTVNARDAMKAAGGVITVSARNLTLTMPLPAVGQDVRPGPYVAFSIADQGTGMPPEVLRHVAEPFFTTKPDGNGTGLGLPMVFGFAAQSGGALTIESHLDHGTIATILLPCTQSPNRAAVPARRNRQVPGLTGRRLLVVEDRPEMSAIVRVVCEAAGMVVTLADRVQTAIDLLRQGGVDMLLCDVMLGASGSGYEVLACAQALSPAVPALMMTGFSGTGEAEPAGHAVLRKPFKVQQLVDALERLSRGDPDK